MNKMLFTLFVLVLIGRVDAATHCQPYTFLKPKFDLNNMQICQSKLLNCPKTGPVLDSRCVKKISQQFSQCTQLVKLAQRLKSSPESLSVEQIGNFVILTQTYIADGKQVYYIISPKHCVLDLNVDLKSIDSKLAQQYKTNPLLAVATDKPTMEATSNDVKFTVNYKVTKNCLACQHIADAKVSYQFLPTGEFKSLKLIQFNEKIN